MVERHEPYEERPGETRYERRRGRLDVGEPVGLGEPTRRISWGSVFAGGVVALVTQLTLTLLGIGIGAATVNPATEAQPFTGLGIGAAIWFALSTIIALFVGGLVAARLANVPRKADAVLHGVVTWGLVFLVSFYLAGSAVGNLIGGVAGVVSQGAAAITQGGAQGQQSMQELRRFGEQALPQAGAQTGQQAAEALSGAAFGAFIVLLLGIGAAIAGAFVGRPKRILRDEVETPIAH